MAEQPQNQQLNEQEINSRNRQAEAESRLARAWTATKSGAGAVAGGAKAVAAAPGRAADWGRGVTADQGFVIIFLLLTLAVHLFIVFTNPPISFIFIIYIIIAIFAALTIFRTDEYALNLNNLTQPTPWVLSAIQIFMLGISTMPDLFSLLSRMLGAETINALVVFVPVWPVVLFFSSSKIPTILKILVFAALAIPIIIPLMSVLMADFGFGQQATQIDLPSAQMWLSEQVDNIGTNWNNFLNATQEMWIHRLDFATGGYYSGSQETPKEKWGVFIEKIETSQQSFIRGDEVTVDANVRARSTDLDNPIDVVFGCDAKKGTKSINISEPNPPSTIFYGPGDEYVQCTLPSSSAIGTYTVTISAEYDFTTTSDLPVTYIDMYKNQGPQTYSKSISSSGPVQVNLGTEEKIPIGVKNGRRSFIGITIENKEVGKVKKVKSLLIYIPDGLKPVDCKLKETGRQDYNYQYTGSFPSQISEYWSYRCSLVMSDPAALLKGSINVPAQRHFKAKADYVYVAQQSAEVLIESPEGSSGVDDGTTGNGDGTYPSGSSDRVYNGALVTDCNLGEFVGDFRVTRYYTPFESDFSSWSTTGNPSLGGMDACRIPISERGFYEAVKCQGGGVGENKGIYRYFNIMPTKEASPYIDYSDDPDSEYATYADKVIAGRSIATNGAILKRGEKYFLRFGDSDPFNGVYWVDDAGGGEDTWLDLYVGWGNIADLPSPPSSAEVYRCS